MKNTLARQASAQRHIEQAQKEAAALGREAGEAYVRWRKYGEGQSVQRASPFITPLLQEIWLYEYDLAVYTGLRGA